MRPLNNIQPTPDMRIEIEPDDAVGITTHYADIFGLLDDAPEDILKTSKDSMSADDLRDYLSGFVYNNTIAEQMTGDYLSEEDKARAIEEVLNEG